MKAKVKRIPEGTEATYTYIETEPSDDGVDDPENGKLQVIVFDVTYCQHIGKVYVVTPDECSDNLWKFYPGERYEGNPVPTYVHEDWLEFLEPVQPRMC